MGSYTQLQASSFYKQNLTEFLDFIVACGTFSMHIRGLGTSDHVDNQLELHEHALSGDDLDLNSQTHIIESIMILPPQILITARQLHAPNDKSRHM